MLTQQGDMDFILSLDEWNNTYKFKEYFEECMGKSIYTVLPEIEKCIYM